MPATQHIETLMAACIERAGFRKGVRLCAWVAQYADAMRTLGEDATIIDAAAHWHEGRATWTRRHAEWRAAFPEVAASDVAGALLRTTQRDGDRSTLADAMATASRLPLTAT